MSAIIRIGAYDTLTIKTIFNWACYMARDARLPRMLRRSRRY